MYLFFRHLFSGSSLLALALICAGLIPEGAHAWPPPFAVTKVTLKAVPTTYQGPATGVIVFEGEITTNGPGLVTYRFLCSNGTHTADKTLDFSRAGTLRVRESFPLSSPYFDKYKSIWEVLQVTAPKSMESGKASCQVRIEPSRVTQVVLKSNPEHYKGPSPATIRFEGKISMNGPGTARYHFVDLEGRKSAEQTLIFREAGTKVISHVVTVYELPTVGQVLKVVAPNVLESGRALSRVEFIGQVTRVTLEVLPERKRDILGNEITEFVGYITTNGPANVRYRFNCTMDDFSPERTLVFGAGGGTKNVRTSRVLPSSLLPLPRIGKGERDWLALEVLAPNEMKSEKIYLSDLVPKKPFDHDPQVGFINFTKLKCLSRTSGLGKDEPYAVFFVAGTGVTPRASRTKVFENVDRGNTREEVVRFWGDPNFPMTVDSSKLIILVALVEHDSASASALTTRVSTQLGETIRKNPDLPRPELARKLKAQMGRILDSRSDDLIGKVQQLTLPHVPPPSGTATVTLTFAGDGGRYELTFEIHRLKWKDPR